MPDLAILGGTFNPVHLGHLLMAEAALTQRPLDQVLWIPTQNPPYRLETALTPFHHRLAMVRLAIAPHPAFALSDLEQRRSGASYAIDTWEDLQQQFPGNTWSWIVGLDTFRTLPKWYRIDDMVTACQWLVAPRPLDRFFFTSNLDSAQTSTDPQSLCETVAQHFAGRSLPLQWHLLEMPAIGISASLIRHYLQGDRSIRYLVPESVRTYIAQHNLYKTNINS
mgnify:CR=1 FL=1